MAEVMVSPHPETGFAVLSRWSQPSGERFFVAAVHGVLVNADGDPVLVISRRWDLGWGPPAYVPADSVRVMVTTSAAAHSIAEDLNSREKEHRVAGGVS